MYLYTPFYSPMLFARLYACSNPSALHFRCKRAHLSTRGADGLYKVQGYQIYLLHLSCTSLCGFTPPCAGADFGPVPGALRAHLFTVSVSGILFHYSVKGADLYTRGVKGAEIRDESVTPIVQLFVCCYTSLYLR